MRDGKFIELVLARAEEKFSREYELRLRGYDIEKVEERVAELPGIPVEEIRQRGRERHRTSARSLVMYWAVRGLNMPGV